MRIFLQPPSPTVSWPTRLLGSLLLPLLALCSGLDAQAASDNDFTYQGIWYTKQSDGVTVRTRNYLSRGESSSTGPGTIYLSGTPGAQGDIVIPSTVFDKDGKAYTVVQIGTGSFATSEGSVEYSDRRITSITIPETVTSISSQAFEGQNKLKTVTIGKGVKTIGEYAFRNTGVEYFYGMEGLETIYKGAFRGCSKIKGICFPTTLTDIKDEAFAYSTIGTFILQSSPKLGKNVFQGTGIIRKAVPEGNTVFDGIWPEPLTFPSDAVISDWWIYDPAKTILYLAPIDFDGSPLPSTIKEIGPQAFKGCDGFTEITLPESVVTVGEMAFYAAKMTKVNFGSNLKKIDANAFFNCSFLDNVNLPEGLEEIGRGAFWSCTALAEIVLPESVRTLENSAFYKSGLKSITVPGQVTMVGQVFEGCAQLKDVTLSEGLTIIPGKNFADCTALEEIKLPASLTSIWDRAFMGCTSLRQLIIGDGVTGLGSEVLKGCTALKQVIVGPGVENIGKDAFADCTALVKIAMPRKFQYTVYPPSTAFRLIYPEGCTVEDDCVYSSDKSKLYYLSLFADGVYEVPELVTTIADQAAYGCNALTGLVIPSTLTSVGKEAFAGCGGLNELTVDAREQWVYFGADCFKDCTSFNKVSAPGLKDWMYCGFNNYASNPLVRAKHLYIDDKEVTELVIPEETESIGSYVFAGAESVKSVVFPESLYGIGAGAFYDCRGLESVVIPDGVTVVGNESFRGCFNLKEVTLGKSVDNVGNMAFSGCGNLRNVTALMPLPTYSGEKIFEGATAVTLTAPTDWVLDYMITEPWSKMSKFECPDGRAGLEWVSGLRYAFNTANGTAAVRKEDYSSLTDIEIPARINQFNVFCNVIKMADAAFENNASLTSVSFGRNLESIPQKAFSGCSNLKSVTFNENSALKSVGQYAFNDCAAMTECLLPQSVTEMGDGAFMGCSSLEKAVVGDAVPYIGYSTFMGCSSLKEVTIGNAVEYIQDMAFQGCSSLTDITFGGALNRIWGEAFFGCSSLTSLTLPPSLEYIHRSAFECENGQLKEIRMGFGLEGIDNRAFAGHDGITDIYITRDTPPRAFNETFSNYKATLHVVPGTVEVYSETAPCWFNFYDNGNVKEMVPVQEVKLSETSFDSPKPGDTFQLSATVSPANATMTEVYWMSTNPRVATVTSDGLVTIQDTFAAPLAFVAYDGEDWEEEPDDSYCEIRAYSMFGNIPEAVCTIGDPSGVDEIAEEIGSGRFDMNLPYDVYTLQGAFVGRDLDGLAGGLYILRQGKNVRKVMVR